MPIINVLKYDYPSQKSIITINLKYNPRSIHTHHRKIIHLAHHASSSSWINRRTRSLEEKTVRTVRIIVYWAYYQPVQINETKVRRNGITLQRGQQGTLKVSPPQR